MKTISTSMSAIGLQHALACYCLLLAVGGVVANQEEEQEQAAQAGGEQQVVSHHMFHGFEIVLDVSCNLE